MEGYVLGGRGTEVLAVEGVLSAASQCGSEERTGGFEVRCFVRCSKRTALDATWESGVIVSKQVRYLRYITVWLLLGFSR